VCLAAYSNMKRHKILFGSAALLSSIVLTGCPANPPSTTKIGVVIPLTGDAASIGENTKKGIDLAVEQINGAKDSKEPKIEVVYEDSRALPAEGLSAFKKLETDKVSMVIGDVASSVTLAIAPVAEKDKVVLLSPLSSAPAITKAGDFIFRNVPSDTLGGQIAASFTVKDRGAKSLAVLSINNEFGIGLKKSFSEKVLSLGAKVVSSQSYDQGSNDFRTQLLKIKESNPDFVFLVGYGEVSQVLIQAKQLGLKTKFIGTGLLEDPNFLKTAKNTSEGVFLTQLQYTPDSLDPQVKTFVESFKKKYGAEASIISAYGYDAMRIASQAIAKSDHTAEGIRDQLYKTQGFDGVTGQVSFDKNGDVMQPMGVKIINGSKFKWVKQKIDVNAK
jgi:branched-chain amino acid transport system substrate-binding protein